MARCYSVPVPNRHPSIPHLWLVSDARNDAVLEHAMARLPRASGVIFRHHHLPEGPRKARFRAISRVARRRGHLVVLAADVAAARRWGAEGAYGAPARLAQGPALLRLVTVHSHKELAAAHRARADAVLISPVFATRSHPGGKSLGALRFRLLAAHARVPVIALGGMTRDTARRLHTTRWAAIDGLSGESDKSPTA